jgi:hypothetical protein
MSPVDVHGPFWQYALAVCTFAAALVFGLGGLAYGWHRLEARIVRRLDGRRPR